LLPAPELAQDECVGPPPVSSVRLSSPWDLSLTVWTVSGVLLCVAAAAILIAVSGSRWHTWILAAAVALVPLAAFALRPTGYEVTRFEVRVLRPIGALQFTIASQASPRELPRSAVSGALRVFGCGGLFGWYGRFRSSALGPFRLYATRTSGYVAVETTEGLLVFTPSSPLETLRALTPLPGGSG